MISKGFLLLFAIVVLMFAYLSSPVLAQDEEGDTALNSTAVGSDTTPDERVLSNQNSGTSNSRSEQDDAWDANRRGLVLPYGKVLKKVKQAAPGDVVKVRLLKPFIGQWTYEVTVLDTRGRYTKLSLNAKTGSVIKKQVR
jgi:uncharacterized membrane protein YkoI